MTSGPLVLGPLLRYVDATSAAVWVETRDRAQVSVHLGDSTWSAGTFAVHGHHYALVEVTGLEPGTTTPYSVQVDGEQVWPEPDSPYPPPVIATQGREGRLRMVFGSCRVSVSQDAAGTHEHGVDALLAYALRMARGDHERPDLVLFLGDQVYADETSQEMQDFIAARRDITEPPGTELRDFEEYAYLYELAWTDGPIRWLLSTLPTAMIFDDHDIRDDWNTSITWQQQMRAHTWWNDRIVAGLASYWVYQHLGNLSPHARAEDEVWQQVTGPQGPDEPDLTEFLDKVAYRADRQPETYRWSYVRDVYGVRLVVIDSRAARILAPDRRSMLDDETKAWLEEQMCGGFRHLLVGTSLPFLLPVALHHLEAWDEAIAEGAWGPRAARFGESLRQKADLEHWAAFEDGFHDMAATALAVASGRRGEPPQTVTFLSGDVH
ncbi:MAG TPA: alkaline phosphatase D family protein, partial [Nocardioidaceae bacterium]|nr:alkaline phosphatase D family protein [Nocardioidaceae bacterium]